MTCPANLWLLPLPITSLFALRFAIIVLFAVIMLLVNFSRCCCSVCYFAVAVAFKVNIICCLMTTFSLYRYLLSLFNCLGTFSTAGTSLSGLSSLTGAPLSVAALCPSSSTSLAGLDALSQAYSGIQQYAGEFHQALWLILTIYVLC